MELHTDVKAYERDSPFEVIVICSGCGKLNPEVSYLGRCYHRPCLEMVFRKNVKDPSTLKALLEVVWSFGRCSTEQSG